LAAVTVEAMDKVKASRKKHPTSREIFLIINWTRERRISSPTSPPGRGLFGEKM